MAQVRVLLLLVCCLLSGIYIVLVVVLISLLFLCVSGSGPTNWSLFIGRSKVDI